MYKHQAQPKWPPESRLMQQISSALSQRSANLQINQVSIINFIHQFIDSLLRQKKIEKQLDFSEVTTKLKNEQAFFKLSATVI